MLEQIAIVNPKVFWYVLPLLLIALFTVWRSSVLHISKKILLTCTYTLLCVLLAGALAQVSIEAYVPQSEQASITILFDNSTSMKEHGIDIEQIAQQIPLKTTIKTIAEYQTSPLNTRISNSLYENGQFLIVSDGFATDGDDLSQIAQSANAYNATLHVLDLDAFKNDASITLFGPPKTFIGTPNTYVARVNGNNKLPGTLHIYLDGEEVYQSADLGIDHPVSLTFSDESTHSISAEIKLSDDITQNNKYYLTTRIIPKPKVLYIGPDRELMTFTEQIFDVTRITTPPEDMSPYSAVIMGNADLSTISAGPFENFVSEGGGLVVFGGNKAYDFGKYDAHDLATVLPVQKGRSGNKEKAVVVIALDISASTEALFSEVSNNKAIEIQKAIAYSIVEQLGDDNVVGVIAFNTEAYVVSELVPLSISRKTVLDKITRIKMQGNTRINIGLGAAYELLREEVGTSAIVLISDGLAGGDSDGPKTRAVAKKLKADEVKLFPIGVGSHIDEAFLRQLAVDTDGIFLRPEETDRLTIQFGQVKDSLGKKPLYSFIIDGTSHPITFGLSQPTTQLNNINQVVPKAGATVLVKTTQGDPALTTWNYGLGRVASWTAFDGISSQKTFLSADSFLFGRILTWGAGDPELKNPPLFVIDDTTLSVDAKVRANAQSLDQLARSLNTTIDELAKFNFEKIDEEVYSGSISASTLGFTSYYGQTFATNYADELKQIGQSNTISNLAKLTNGKVVTQEQLGTLELSTTQSAQKIKTQKSIQIPLVIAALVALLLHILIGKQKQGKKRRIKK